jgi:hypothetical protein
LKATINLRTVFGAIVGNTIGVCEVLGSEKAKSAALI